MSHFETIASALRLHHRLFLEQEAFSLFDHSYVSLPLRLQASVLHVDSRHPAVEVSGYTQLENVEQTIAIMHACFDLWKQGLAPQGFQFYVDCNGGSLFVSRLTA